MVRDSDGNENLVHAGEAFEVADNHDAWVGGHPMCRIGFHSSGTLN